MLQFLNITFNHIECLLLADFDSRPAYERLIEEAIERLEHLYFPTINGEIDIDF